MSYRLEMSAEIYDWLAELRDSDPPAAVMAGRALAALADGGDRLGPPPGCGSGSPRRSRRRSG